MTNPRIFLLNPKNNNPKIIIWSLDETQARKNACIPIEASVKISNNPPETLLIPNSYEDINNVHCRELSRNDFTNFVLLNDQILMTYEGKEYALKLDDPWEIQ